MRVIAAKGTKCPMEGRPREYISDSAAVDVPESTYYMRLKSDGSLLDAPADAAPAEDASGAKKSPDKGGNK